MVSEAEPFTRSRNMRTKAVCLVSMIAGFWATTGISATIKGVVSDTLTKAKVESVLVTVKGTATKAYTNAQGVFSLTTSNGIRALAPAGSLLETANAAITVYGSNGVALLDGHVGTLSQVLSGLPDGVYLVTAEQDGRTYAGKTVKLNGLCRSGLFTDRLAKTSAAVTLVYTHKYYTTREAAATEGDTNVVAKLRMWFPDASNTGWQHTGVVLRTVKNGDSGTGWHVETVGGSPVFYVTAANTVVDGLDIPFMVKVFANNVTIQRSRIVNGGYYCMFIGDPPTTYSGLHLIDVELDGKNDAVNFVIAANASRNATFTRINCHGMGSSGPRLGTGTIIEDSWLHDYVHGTDGHECGISSNGNDSNMIIRHNSVSINTAGASSCLALYRDFGKPDNVLVEYNLFNGGNYGVMCGIQASDGSYPPVNNIRFIKNVFGRELHPECGYYGAYAQFSSTNGTGNIWSGNTWGSGAAATGAHAAGDPVN
jgi:hypothetical protein